MKILIFSDSHGSCETMKKIILKEKPDTVIHLGDTVRDIKHIITLFDNIEFFYVPGNNDYGYVNKKLEIIIGEKKFLICHGHQYYVKNGLGRILAEVKQSKPDILLFGHTHIPENYYDKKVLIFNPGSCKESFYSDATYGTIKILKDEITSEIIKVEK